jgi:branched-chain amino acid transport system substrate-binding protein
MRKNNSTGAGKSLIISRRRLIVGAGSAAGGALLAAQTPRAWAQTEAANIIKVGFVSPLTGPLAGFGEADPHVLDLVRKRLKDGLSAGGKKYAVEIVGKDTQSDPSRAGQLAKELINRDKVDFMLSTSTPETVNPVADACEAAGVPSLSTIMPWEAFYFGRGAKPGAPSPFKWTYLFAFGVQTFEQCYTSQWSKTETNKKVGALYPNDADGNAIREHLAPLLAKAGYTMIDAGPYEDGTTDFSAQIAKFKQEKCEIFNSFPLPPDFAVFWRQAAQQGYTKMVKIVQVAKTGLFPSQIEALGQLGYNIASAAYWTPAFPYKSESTGLTGSQLSESYEKASGKQWNQQLGATASLFDAGLAVLETSGNPKDKDAVANAIAKLNTVTAIGRVDFKKGPVPNCVATPLIGSQWVKAKGGKFKLDLVVTDNACDPNVPVTAKLQPYS